MPQNIFSPELNAVSRKHFVALPNLPAPNPSELAQESGKLPKSPFERLLLFDKLTLKITGESIAVLVLIRIFGSKGFDALLEQGAFEFISWDQDIVFLTQNIPKVDSMESMVHNGPPYIDPEQSIETGLL